MRRMLWDFSSGTQAVVRFRRPVTQTAWVGVWPADRKWKLSGAFQRARGGGGVRVGLGPPSDLTTSSHES